MRKRACEICDKIDFVDSHHIESKAFKGSNKKFNKIKICPSCHRKIHCGEIIVEGIFLTTAGDKVIWRYAQEESITKEEPKVYLIH